MKRAEYLKTFMSIEAQIADLQSQIDGLIVERDSLSPEAALLRQLKAVRVDTLKVGECFIHEQELYRLKEIFDTGRYKCRAIIVSNSKTMDFNQSVLVHIVKED